MRRSVAGAHMSGGGKEREVVGARASGDKGQEREAAARGECHKPDCNPGRAAVFIAPAGGFPHKRTPAFSQPRTLPHFYATASGGYGFHCAVRGGGPWLGAARVEDGAT